MKEDYGDELGVVSVSSFMSSLAWLVPVVFVFVGVCVFLRYMLLRR